MTLPGFPRPRAEEGSSPFLFWNHDAVSAHGAAVACPQCAGGNLHLDTVHFAVPTRDHYTPTVGLSINPTTGAIMADDTARALHASINRGPMLSIGYWCEYGCHGRIELRAHKGRLFGGLHHEPPFEPEDDTPS